ncbi:hypothetical protein [Pseudomonas aeruginosa]|uniref:hypothetical protein n=1 Tax=Pseudomonas aeruginosa TaxID=287 RepID=UPI00249B0622|nr:hypothetical protein [Pseudomonas aeruginosa]WGW38240.1 hypothetical protein P7I86_02970 [Pseudomonas aeruginosa]WGW50863.1 hypothetical protein P7I87_02995 [Pseudomonas aeruginosa]
MAPFILRRLGYSLLILLGVTLITYLLLFMLPADPARQIAGRSATLRWWPASAPSSGSTSRSTCSTGATWPAWYRATWAARTSSAARWPS